MAPKLNDYLLMATVMTLSHAWNYEQQDKWPGVCQKAVAQSPIDLCPGCMVKIKMSPIVFKNWDKEYVVSVMNNGHTVVINLPNNQHISFSGGGLPGTFELVQFHFHWGSEHTLNRKRKALEAHFVGFNNKFKDLEEALNYANGVAVLGILYELSYKDNPALQKITQKIKNIKNVKQSMHIKLNPMKLLPKNMNGFYRYFGSLTTPDCNDIVVWTVFSELCQVSRAQVDEFRSISKPEGGKLTENFRKIQPLNGRTVYKIGVN